MSSFKYDAKELFELLDTRDPKAFFEKYKNVQTLAEGLKTDIRHGLSQQEALTNFAERKEKYGTNDLPQPPLTSLFELIYEGLQDSTLIMLMISAVVSLIFGIYENPGHGWIEGTAILIAVFLVVMVASVNDYQKERQFRKLNEKKENKAIKVIRDGQQQEISIYEVNVGDVIVLATGDIIAADGIIIESHNVHCDNSALTGESDEIKINDEHPFLISGCMVCDGFGKMVATCVGSNSISGRMMEKLQKKSEDTPLQEKLEILANDYIANMGLAAAALILVVLIAKLAIVSYINSVPFSVHMISAVIKYFITAVTIVVVAVPEGLPLAVTIALAYSMVQMVKDQNLVRHLDACETMGGATTICSDKTGTLTKNLMTVVKGWFGKIYDIKDFPTNMDAEYKQALFEGININTTVYQGTNEKGVLDFIGNKTECALLNFAKDLGADFKQIQTELPVEKLFPFSSKIKSMSTLVKTSKGYRQYTKGASEWIIINRCDKVLSPQGELKDLSSIEIQELEKIIDNLASEGLRTIALCYRDFTPEEFKEHNWEVPADKNHILLGITAIKDPLRPEVNQSVKECQQAGIVVRMVTGDNISTAKKIASECGILTEGGVAIEGPEFRNLTSAQMEEIIPKLQVMARSSPTDKHLLVSKLKEMGEVVAVTGDGTNDAPALKEAHVGFSMGIQGTEVAKEASDIILMDDNFSSIVKAVMWGRNVYDSIRKFLQFQLTVNLVAVSLAFIGAVSDEEGESPLKPVQLLWVNLIMDTMAALALATDSPTKELLERRPYGKNDQLITKRMWLNIVGQAIFQLFVNLAILYKGELIFGVEHDSVEHKTIIFNVFVMCQIFNEINCRRLGTAKNIFEGLLSNTICMSVLAFTIIMQFAMVEFGGEFAGTSSLSLNQWIVCTVIGSFSFPIGFLLRLIPLSEPEQLKAEIRSMNAKKSWSKLREATKAHGIVSFLQTEKIRRKHRINTAGIDQKN